MLRFPNPSIAIAGPLFAEIERNQGETFKSGGSTVAGALRARSARRDSYVGCDVGRRAGGLFSAGAVADPMRWRSTLASIAAAVGAGVAAVVVALAWNAIHLPQLSPVAVVVVLLLARELNTITRAARAPGDRSK